METMRDKPVDSTLRLLSLREAAAVLAISERKLWGIPEDELPRVRLGRSVRFDVEDLKKLVARQKHGA